MCTMKEYDTPRWSFDGLEGENKMVFKSETLLLNVLKTIKRKRGRSYLDQNLSFKSHMLRSFFSIFCGQSLQTKWVSFGGHLLSLPQSSARCFYWKNVFRCHLQMFSIKKLWKGLSNLNFSKYPLLEFNTTFPQTLLQNNILHTLTALIIAYSNFLQLRQIPKRYIERHFISPTTLALFTPSLYYIPGFMLMSH